MAGLNNELFNIAVNVSIKQALFVTRTIAELPGVNPRGTFTNFVMTATSIADIKALVSNRAKGMMGQLISEHERAMRNDQCVAGLIPAGLGRIAIGTYGFKAEPWQEFEAMDVGAKVMINRLLGAFGSILQEDGPQNPYLFIHQPVDDFIRRFQKV